VLVRCALWLCVRARHARERKKIESFRNEDPNGSRNRVVFVVDWISSIRRLTSSGALENVARKVWPTKGQWRRICIELEVNVCECVRAENASGNRVMIRHLNVIRRLRFLTYLLKFVHFSNFSAFWRDYGCARAEVLTVCAMRVDTVPAFVFDRKAVMRS